MTTIRLYEYPRSGDCYKVRLVLAQLDVPYGGGRWDTMAGETRPPELVRINPSRRVYALKMEEGMILPESNAILFFLAEGTPLLSEGRRERAEVLRWTSFEGSAHQPNLAVARFLAQSAETTDEPREVLGQKQKAGHAALGVMEGHLASRDFLVGNTYSIADAALYAHTHVADEGGFDLDPHPAVRAWLDRVSARPGYAPMMEG